MAPHTKEELMGHTLPILKAMCKDLRITGYSKLTKTGIVDKILAHQSSTSSSAQPAQKRPLESDGQSQPTAKKKVKFQQQQAGVQPVSTSSASSSFCQDQVPLQRVPDATKPPFQSNDVSCAASLLASTSTAAACSSNVFILGSQTTCQSSGTSIRPNAQPAKPSLLISASKKMPPAKPIKSSATTASAQNNSISTRAPSSKPLPPMTQTDIVKPHAPTMPCTGTKRFTPLVVNKPVPEKTITNICLSTAVPYLDFAISSPPATLLPIPHPPPMSERRLADSAGAAFAVLKLNSDQLTSWARVCPTFRYAVHRSAYFRVTTQFPGDRLKVMLDRLGNKKHIVNLWPYLKLRTKEYQDTMQTFDNSFLGILFKNKQDVISSNLWKNPDHEKQMLIAVRFLLTRVFFSYSVGDGRTWMEGVIINVQEIVKDEIWTVTVCNGSDSRTYYVLEPTCEVIGRPPPDSDATDSHSPADNPIRCDWSGYIQARLLQRPKDLIQHFYWTNHEEYDKGISRLWLKRMAAAGEHGTFAREVAERYIFASVVANSVSGQWKSSTEMRQDFDGLPNIIGIVRPSTRQKVTLFLPAHHHVESVHFETIRRKPLHPALAIVQTPAREYFILKDNGMQVGCEENGVAEIWCRLIGCTPEGEQVETGSL